MGAPTSSAWRRRYLIAKTTMRTATSTAKNVLTATRKKYRLSTRDATVDACSGNSGVPGSINLSSVAASRRPDRPLAVALAPPHDDDGHGHGGKRQQARAPHDPHHREAVQ